MNSSAKGDADRHCLAARFVDGPHVSAPDKAEQRLADWLADLAPEQAAAIDDLITRFPRAKTILLGIAEASPYLFDLVARRWRARAPAARMRAGAASGATDRNRPAARCCRRGRRSRSDAGCSAA